MSGFSGIKNKKNDLLYFRRNWAKCKIVLQTKETHNGTQRRTTAKLNSEKIADAARFMLQNNYDFSEFKYDVLKEKAENELNAVFTKLGLNEETTTEKRKENRKKKRIAVSNWIEQYIEKNFPNKLEMGYDDFMKNINIKRAHTSITNGLEILFEAQESNIYELEHPIMNLQTGEIAIKKTRIAAIPKVSLVLDSQVEGMYPTIMDFAKANIRNKKQLIKSLILELSPQYLYYVLSIGNDYVASYKSKRDQFKSVYSHKLDIFLTSLEGIQYNFSLVTIQVEELKNMLGVKSDKEYKDFKRDVLNKAIGDIEKYLNKKIDYVEIREGRKIVALRFAVRRNEDDPTFAFLYDYITTQLHYFSKYNIKSQKKFKTFLKNTDIKNDEFIGDKKTFEEWRIEAEEAFRAEQEVLKMMEENLSFYEASNLIYSIQHHTLLKTEYLDEFDDKTGECLQKKVFLKKDNQIISNPVMSLKYLQELEIKQLQNSVQLIDILPFSYYDKSMEKWILIKNIEIMKKYKEKIEKDILLKDTNRFDFEDRMKKAIFERNVESQKFSDVNRMVRLKIQQSLFGNEE